MFTIRLTIILNVAIVLNICNRAASILCKNNCNYKFYIL